MDLILACEWSKTEKVGGGDGRVRDEVRDHHGLIGSGGQSPRHGPQHARAESGNRGGNGAEEKTAGPK